MLALWQGERHIAVPGAAVHFAAPAGDDDIFLPPHAVDRWGGKTGRGQVRLPQELSRPFVEGPELAVTGSRNKQQAARRNRRTAIVLRTGMYALRGEFGIVAQREIGRASCRE